MVALAALGGPEIAYLVGVVLGAAEAGSLVVARRPRHRRRPRWWRWRSSRPWRRTSSRDRRAASRPTGAVNAHLGLEPLLSLRLRAGEGVGALLAAQLLRTAAALRAQAGRVADR